MQQSRFLPFQAIFCKIQIQNHDKTVFLYTKKSRVLSVDLVGITEVKHLASQPLEIFKNLFEAIFGNFREKLNLCPMKKIIFPNLLKIVKNGNFYELGGQVLGPSGSPWAKCSSAKPLNQRESRKMPQKGESRLNYFCFS